MLKYLVSLLVIPLCLFAEQGNIKFRYNLCISAIFQDEAPYLKEWIDWHLGKGVDHFYLYNNNSHDDYLSVLKPYIKNKTVELIQWNSYQNENDFHHFCFEVQTGAYNNALQRSKGKSKWLAIIDCDEYIVPVCEKSIPDILEKHFANVSGLCVNWQCYGTSHIWQVPQGQMLKNLTWKSRVDHPKNLYYKSIVQSLHVKNCTNPHLCNYLKGHWHINTNRETFEIQTTGVFVDKIKINHYWSKDEKFLTEVKIPRYKIWGQSAETIRSIANEMNEIYDPIY